VHQLVKKIFDNYQDARYVRENIHDVIINPDGYIPKEQRRVVNRIKVPVTNRITLI